MTLRDAWTTMVAADDYEAHMAGIGQAHANALLVRDLMALLGLSSGARVLIAGAGTGQMFDSIPVETFAPFHLTCSDISAALLDRLSGRVRCETVVDDVEDSRLEPGFGAVLLVLVLEHVDFRKALASLSRLAPERFVIVIQENPQSMTSAVTPGRIPPGTMSVFASEAQPHLIPFADLVDELGKQGYGLERRQEMPVADGKKMIGSVFRRA